MFQSSSSYFLLSTSRGLPTIILINQHSLIGRVHPNQALNLSPSGTYGVSKGRSAWGVMRAKCRRSPVVQSMIAE